MSLTFRFLSTVVLLTHVLTHTHSVFHIMIDPAGDSYNPGRQIEDSCERGLTLQYAQYIKKTVEESSNSLKVTITRSAGERVTQEQKAHCANTLHVDLYLHIGMYSTEHTQPEISIYMLATNKDLLAPQENLHFLPYDQAHVQHIPTTQSYAQIFMRSFTESKNSVFGLLSCPFAPLVGIQQPAVGIEIGITSEHDWIHTVAPLKDALHEITQQVTS